MNQILKPEINVSPKTAEINNLESQTKKKNKFYKLQFIISSLVACCFLIAFLIRMFKINQNEKISEQLMSIYNVSTLYSNNITYSTQSLESLYDTNTFSDNSNPFVIGIIKIDKINLNYPILSESTKELLDISLCRFAGPMPNEIGNLCIAGHNYVDYKFFSRLNELEIDDTIKIYDLSGKMVEYKISKKYEVNPDDISCTSQDTNNRNIITLLTCNNVSGKRLVIVAEPT